MTYSLPGGSLSPTKVSSYRDCPACFYWTYVRPQPRPGNISFAIGTCAHRAAEVVARRIIAEQEVSSEEALEAGVEAFQRTVAEPFDHDEGIEFLELDLGKFDHLGHAKDEAVSLTRYALTRLPDLLRERRVMAAETDLSALPPDVLAAAFPFPVKGRIDFLYGDLHDMAPTGMTDLKTTSRNAGPDMNGKLQFSFYSLPAHMNGVDWRVGADMLIKTKAPDLVTYWANRGTGYLSEANYQVARATILQVAQDISAGRFPVGQGWNGRHDYEHGLDDYSIAVGEPL